MTCRNSHQNYLNIFRARQPCTCFVLMDEWVRVSGLSGWDLVKNHWIGWSNLWPCPGWSYIGRCTSWRLLAEGVLPLPGVNRCQSSLHSLTPVWSGVCWFVLVHPGIDSSTSAAHPPPSHTTHSPAQEAPPLSQSDWSARHGPPSEPWSYGRHDLGSRPWW